MRNHIFETLLSSSRYILVTCLTYGDKSSSMRGWLEHKDPAMTSAAGGRCSELEDEAERSSRGTQTPNRMM